MALTSNDETDLLLPLYRGIEENPRFSTFLDRLRRRTGARYVSLALAHDGQPVSASDMYYSGMDAPIAGSGYYRLSVRPYRVYGPADFSAHDAGFSRWHEQNLIPLGLADERFVRIPVAPGLSGWLLLARDRPCSAADSALISNLAPYIETVLHTLHQLERERAGSELSSSGLARMGTGWILFDAETRVLAIEPATRRQLHRIIGAPPEIGERLMIGAAAASQLSDAAARMAKPDARHCGHALLWRDPRVDALLTGIDPKQVAPLPGAQMIAYCRFQTEGTAGRARQFSGLFDLPPREAELAVALADGHTIAETAQAMGLTVETARNYSKKLYAKLGVRGQVELVRLVLQSSAALA